MSNQPNIIFVLAEQHNFRFMGCAGDPYVHTPVMDTLARQGTRLEQCYCNSPLCVPSRASLMTGRLPHNNQVFNNQQTLHTDIPTMAHSLNIAGYETVLAGRMHFYGPDQNHGFEKRLVGDVTVVYQGQDLNEKIFGELNGTMLQKRVGIEKSGPGDSSVYHFDNDVREATLDFLDKRTDERPLFLTVGFFSAHPPFVCPEDKFRYYYDMLPPLTPSEVDFRSLHPAIQAWLTSRNVIDVTADELRRVRAAYYAMVEFLDDNLGQILDKAAQKLDMSNTVVIYTADHGESLGINRMWWKGTYYDTSSRVPAIVSWPGHFRENSVEHGLTCLADLTATCIDLAGAPTLPLIYGMSLVKVLEGNATIAADRSIISELGTYPSNKDRPAAMLRKGDYKLVTYVGYGDVQLFNLKEDPEELQDLGRDAAYSDLVRRMKAELEQQWNGSAVEEFCMRYTEQFKLIRQWANTTHFEMPTRWYPPENGNYVLPVNN